MPMLASVAPIDRPREKLLAKGPNALTDHELLAVLLGTGTQGQDVLTTAQKLLVVIDQKQETLTPADLQNINGVGPTKSAVIAAALEFTRRRVRPEGHRITQPADVLPLLGHLQNATQEHLVCLTLNGAHEVIASRVLTIGLANRSQIHPREVFADAITDRACAIILAHNHPSGSLKPSQDDRVVTQRIQSCGELLGIELLDHVIFGKTGFVSMREGGIFNC